MKRFLFSLIAALSLVSPVFADAESAHREVAQVKASEDEVCKFIEAHGDDLIKAAGNKVLGRDDKLVKIQRNTRKGDFIYTVEETVKHGDYSSKLIKSHQGTLAKQVSTIKVSKKGKHTNIEVEIEAVVTDPDVNGLELKVELKKSVHGVVKYLEKSLK